MQHMKPVEGAQFSSGCLGHLACPRPLWSMPLTLQIQAQGKVSIVNSQAAQDAYITPDLGAGSVSGIYINFFLPAGYSP